MRTNYTSAQLCTAQKYEEMGECFGASRAASLRNDEAFFTHHTHHGPVR